MHSAQNSIIAACETEDYFAAASPLWRDEPHSVLRSRHWPPAGKATAAETATTAARVI
jgi:hypothetical protein